MEERARFARSTNEREPRAARNDVRKGGLAQRPTCIASIAVHRGHTLRTTSAIGNGDLESPDRGQYTESANTPWTYPVPESPRTEKPRGKHTPVRVSICLLFWVFFICTRGVKGREREKKKNALLSVGHADAAGNEDNDVCESLGKGFAKWCK